MGDPRLQMEEWYRACDFRARLHFPDGTVREMCLTPDEFHRMSAGAEYVEPEDDEQLPLPLELPPKRKK